MIQQEDHPAFIERKRRIELPSSPWQGDIIATIRLSLIFVDRMGIEPTTLSLQGRNAEALEHASPYVFVRVTRIELTSPTWKAGVITIIRYPHFCW